MRGQAGIGRRAQRLEAMQQRAAVFDLAQHLAAELGITAEDLLAEARALQRRMHAAGAMTRNQQMTLLAAEGGIPEDELRAELARVRPDA